MKKNINKWILGILTFFCIAVGVYLFYDFYSLKNAEVEILDQQKTISLYTEQTGHIQVRAKKEKYQDKVRFISQNEKIVTVSDKGELYAVSPGKTEIEVGVQDSHKKKKIEVEIKPHTFKIDKNYKKTIQVNEQLKLKAYDEITSQEDDQIDWVSSNDQIASVKKGQVVANRIGNVRISIKKNGKIEDTIGLTIKPREVTVDDVDFDFPQSLNMQVSKTYDLAKNVTVKNGIQEPIKYTSSQPHIVSVSANGKLTARKSGTAQVIVSVGKVKKSMQVKVSVKKTLPEETQQISGLVKGPYITHDLLKKAGISQTTKLMIVAHPDDETLWGGGHLAEGNWFVVCLTNGNNAKRKQEYKNALQCLGAKGIILSYYDLRNGKRDNWETVKTNILKDLHQVLSYKKWEMIATHNPAGEYGHIHHKMTNRYVTQTTQQIGQFASLYYFGTFYKPQQLPSDLTVNMTDYQQSMKRKALNLYTSQLKSIDKKWAQMIPYEHWTKAA